MIQLNKGIIIAIVSALIIVGGVYYAANKEAKFTTPPAPIPSIQTNPLEEKIHIVNNSSEAGPGPLTKENVSLAGIHIGDSQEQVFKLYGEPTEKEQFHSTPFHGWIHGWNYEELGLFVSFYRKNEFEPIQGVVDVLVSAPSTLHTNTGIGIGDSIEKIVDNYDSVNGSKIHDPGNYRDIWINGANKFSIENSNDFYYYPTLRANLQNEHVIRIELSNI